MGVFFYYFLFIVCIFWKLCYCIFMLCGSKIIRVFPRRTESTPCDDLVYFGGPPLWDVGDYVVHVSCTFTWDQKRSESLAWDWTRAGYEVALGGPGFDEWGYQFIPGRYLKKGLVITSRGCNNKCWFCKVPRREGKLRELEIQDGWDVLDNNLLQCSQGHILGVFQMLNRQERRDANGRRKGVKFTGGFEAAILKDWHVDLIALLKPKPEILYFAYDTPDDLDPLIEAAKKMRAIGFNNNRVGCYVLMGYPNDTIEKALERLQQVVDLDIMPFAMLWADEKQIVHPDWKDLQRRYAKPAITRSIHKDQFGQFFLESGSG